MVVNLLEELKSRPAEEDDDKAVTEAFQTKQAQRRTYDDVDGQGKVRVAGGGGNQCMGTAGL